jgi:hypothetical protein
MLTTRPPTPLASDLGSEMRWGRQAVLCLRPVFDVRVFQLKFRTSDWSAVAICACKVIRLFSVVLCVARTVYKLNLGLL